MYNALLGATDLDGRNFNYTNPLIDGWRTPWHVCPCCVGNIPRTLLMIPTWTYVTGEKGIYVNLFIGSRIKVERVAGTDVEMVQKTDYPWSGNVSITVNPAQPRKFSVHVRIPDRKTSKLYSGQPEVSGYRTLAVNGKSIHPKIEKGYAVITRQWKAGDRIDLELPMQPQRIRADERIEATRGLVALRYGPLIYNVERADQADLAQPLGTAPIEAQWRGDLLEGVMVLKGSWANGKPMLAIPNYARMNRIGQEAGDGAPAGDPSINYAPGTAISGATTPTNAASAPTERRQRRVSDGPESIVWMKAAP